jgi:hypothetical protein
MKKFLSLAAVLVAALFLASCCRFHHGPGAARAGSCVQCPKAGDCACAKGADCKCVDCKCPGCSAKKGASPCAQCPNAALDETELKHGPVGAPEGAPAK